MNSLTGNSLTVSISDSLKPGEKIIQRFDISVPLAERRRDQALMAFAVTVIFSAMLFGLVLLSRVHLHLLNLAQLAVISVVFWKIFDRFLKVTFPDYSELVVTNQRLILRAGAAYTEWISDYDNEIEVFVLAEISSFAVRPSGRSCTPREVYVKSVSPFQNGRQLADLLRSFREARLLESGSPLVSNSITSSASTPAHFPPGIAVTHAFLSHQLRSFIASIPLLPVFPVLPVIPVIPVLPTADIASVTSLPETRYESDTALPAEVLSANTDASQSAETSPTTHTPPELGDTGYQFGVDK